MRKSSVFFSVIVIQLSIAAGIAAHADLKRKAALPHMWQMSQTVSDLALTDLCLFTEARYTRHPSMADFFTPFQDHPFSFDHFPSGSLMSVPGTLRK